jgi:hypothetical protein
MPYAVIGDRPITRPQIWDPIKEIPVGLGGAMLDAIMLDASRNYGVLLKGCPIYLDMDTRTAHVVKSASVIGGTTSAPQVSKEHLFIAGDIVYVSGDAVTVNSIDESNDSYDVLTLSAACAGAVTGQILEQGNVAGSGKTKLYVPNTLLGNDYKIFTGENVNLVFRINEWVRKDRFAYPLSASTIASLAPNIIIK